MIIKEEYDFDSTTKIYLNSDRFKTINKIVYQLTDVIDFDLYEAVVDDALGRNYVGWECTVADDIPYITQGNLQDIVLDYADVDISEIY